MDGRPNASSRSDRDTGDTEEREQPTLQRTLDGSTVSASRSLGDDVAVLIHEVGVLVRSNWDRTRIGLRSTARAAIFRAVAFFIVIVFLSRAAWFVLDGLRGAFIAWTGSIWAGDLIAGTLVVGGAVLIVRRAMHRADLDTARAMREKYGDCDRDSDDLASALEDRRAK